ncbi:MAG TPA: hypothetical protein PLM53_10760 [Spirochaetota bacterium]|nr:hypothetical protein [Spirochaetota bacterium]HPL15140.1 hypothetical protein [Spirochaetota bacterium]HQF08729.1 hypothetical protein [Spirochaetota bacterium]HQH97570.1 hypothetical protein [Spirochaetota bacterium]HRS77649.1 hypothetical protein [Spirochaetota bacterium]
MKKAIVLISCFVFLIGLPSCGGGKNTREKNSGDFSLDEKYDQKGSTTGRAEGVAAIFDNDKALARDRAINDARNKLVEKVLGTTVSGESMVKDYELVKMLIQSKSYGLVKKEKIVSEKSDSDMYRVELEGTVEPAVVEDAIEDALNRYGKPKFMILISETFEGRVNMPGFTETELQMQERMGAVGFQFVDMQIVQDLMKRQYGRMSRAMTGQVTEDVQNMLLNDVGAEVLIIGTAQTQDQSNVLRAYSANMKSKSAIVRLKAVDVYSGRILATTSKDAPGVHIQSDTASKRAIEAVVRKILGGKDESTGQSKPGPFMDEIIKQFVKSATHRQINLFITGLDYNGMKKFREEIENRIRGVQQVLEKGRVGRAARVEVYFAGTTAEFVDELKAKAGKLGFEFEIPDTFPNRVTIQAKAVGK